MYVEFENNILVRDIYIGRAKKKDEVIDNTTTYSIVYELLSGEVLKKTFDNQADRDAAYNQLLT